MSVRPDAQRPRQPRSASKPQGAPTVTKAANAANAAKATKPNARPATASSFTELGVPDVLNEALAPLGITKPSPIQAATLPDSLAGRDVLGRGKTGSGKTFAFLLPLVARLAADRRRPKPGRPRALVLAPTRELAAQIEESLKVLEAPTHLRSRAIFGGVGQNPQVKALQAGVDVVIACPGRLLDLMGQGHVDFSDLEVAVLDEADQMADMGFLPMVKRILDKVPGSAQKMLFSATLDNGIDVLVKKYLHNPVVHEADSVEGPQVQMEHHVINLDPEQRLETVKDLASAPGRAIVFTRTKYGAKKLAKQLVQQGVPAVELHGNLSQGARTRNLEAFGSGRVNTLVATDIAARGIHVDDVAVVVHADPPVEHKAYVHRSGRTARAGQSGTVITLVTPDQRGDVRTLMRQARIKPTVHALSPAVLTELAPGERVTVSAAEAQQIANPEALAQKAAQQKARQRKQGGQGGQGGRGKKPANAKRSQAGSRGQSASGGQGQQGSGQRSPRGARGGQGGQGGRGRGGRSRGQGGSQRVYSTGSSPR
jgi:superfamily II DNA/RNA helicase